MKQKTVVNRNSIGRDTSCGREMQTPSWFDQLTARNRVLIDWGVAGVMLAGFAVILALRIHTGVVPHDDGTLGHAAERVLEGQLPHRDFDDPYTGGLAMLNAAAFKLFGVNVLSARLVLLGFTLLTFGVLYRMFRRTLPIEWAALLTITAFSWSVPHYFTPMPSWYNLFFGIFTVAALQKYAETERREWLAAAGGFTGLSFLIKVIGLYFVAVAALYVIFFEQRRSERSEVRRQTQPLCTGFVITGLALFVCGVMSIVGVTSHWPGWLTFVVPAATLAGFLAWREWKLRHHDARQRLLHLLVDGGWFAVGLIVPVAFFLIPYVVTGSFEQWLEGVFIQPLRRLDEEMARTINLRTFSIGGIMAAFGGLAVALAAFNRTTMIWSSAAAVGAFALVMISVRGGTTYAACWDAARLLPAVACLGLCFHLLRRPMSGRRNENAHHFDVESRAFLFAAAAGLFGLVQYPIVNGIYFLYVAPLIIAAVWFAAETIVPHGRWPGAAWCGIVLGFTVLWVWPGSSFTFGTVYVPLQAAAELNSQRMPLRYDATSVEVLDAVTSVIQEHSAPGSPIFAFPDTPEIYFLSNRKNPTRTFFDVLDPDYGTPDRDRRLLKLLEREKVQLIVERNFTSFSTEEPTDEFRTEIRRRYPNRFIVQDSRMRYYTIRWRERVADAARSTAMFSTSPSGL
jgi:hypothetical protein